MDTARVPSPGGDSATTHPLIRAHLGSVDKHHIPACRKVGAAPRSSPRAVPCAGCAANRLSWGKTVVFSAVSSCHGSAEGDPVLCLWDAVSKSLFLWRDTEHQHPGSIPHSFPTNAILPWWDLNSLLNCSSLCSPFTFGLQRCFMGC